MSENRQPNDKVQQTPAGKGRVRRDSYDDLPQQQYLDFGGPLREQLKQRQSGIEKFSLVLRM